MHAAEYGIGYFRAGVTGGAWIPGLLLREGEAKNASVLLFRYNVGATSPSTHKPSRKNCIILLNKAMHLHTGQCSTIWCENGRKNKGVALPFGCNGRFAYPVLPVRMVMLWPWSHQKSPQQRRQPLEPSGMVKLMG